MEKKEIKISLGTFVCLIIIAILVVAVIMMGMYIIENNKVTNNDGLASNNKQQGVNANKVEQLNVNSELVQKLYSYVNNTEPDRQLVICR